MLGSFDDSMGEDVVLKGLDASTVLAFIRVKATPEEIDKINEEACKVKAQHEELEYIKSREFAAKIYRELTEDGTVFTVYADTRGEVALYGSVKIHLLKLDNDDIVTVLTDGTKFNPPVKGVAHRSFRFTHPSVRKQFEVDFQKWLQPLIPFNSTKEE